MTIDRDLVREIKRACGDGSRAPKFALLGAVRQVQYRMSQSDCAGDPRRAMLDALKQSGRAAFALCLAATIHETRRGWVPERLVQWSQAVLALWTCKPCDLLQVAYHDRLHPSRIAEYAGSFIALTCEEVS